ncbi:hypothetical protein DCS_01187 [Drechmeria coniospora]|uniref:Ras modification protein ERF4 n=1 Tax=Drechmeria coniospora TaxID=98403 RepID=A0A151GSK9_DRECN|nr:hypothetical protein DCS_01187 [Drechmeria coniospora]KYK60053.1 hypothetical protein DCS_01187 [Drechmeria coniospora]
MNRAFATNPFQPAPLSITANSTTAPARASARATATTTNGGAGEGPCSRGSSSGRQWSSAYGDGHRESSGLHLHLHCSAADPSASNGWNATSPTPASASTSTLAAASTAKGLCEQSLKPPPTPPAFYDSLPAAHHLATADARAASASASASAPAPTALVAAASLGGGHLRHHRPRCRAELDPSTTPRQPLSPPSTSPSPLDASESTRLSPRPPQTYDPSGPPQRLAAAVTTETLHLRTGCGPNGEAPRRQRRAFPSPFRSRAGCPAAYSTQPPRPPSARLWNPTNSTPRGTRQRRRRSSSPPAPPVPLRNPAFDRLADGDDHAAVGEGDHPLLGQPQRWQSKRAPATCASLPIDQTSRQGRRISLPGSVHASCDGRRSQIPTTGDPGSEFEPLHDGASQPIITAAPLPEGGRGDAGAKMAPDEEAAGTYGSKDLERGPDVMQPRLSNVSVGDAIGSALSSTDSSIMGEEMQADNGEEWGPQHACFPHLNPHVPTDSAEYASTRVIRIRRDWLLKGDLAPTFSNLYPEILDPAGVSEQEFRRIIDKLNGELVSIFNPYSVRNVLDCLLGLATGWLWEDLGLTAIKSRLNHLEKWIESWNLDMAKAFPAEESALPPKIIPLRQTGYLTLDIQIPDPEIGPAHPSAGLGEPRLPPMEPAPALAL